MMIPWAALGGKVWGWLKAIPDWVIMLVIAILCLKWVDIRAERRGRDAEKAKRRETDAQQTIALERRVKEISDDLRDRAEAAQKAPADVPRGLAADELFDERPDIGAVLRRGRGDGER